MIEDMLWACAVILACLLFYHYALPALKRFDQRNVARIHQQDRDQADANAHFRHALDVAGEQVEEVQEIKVAGGNPLPVRRRRSSPPATRPRKCAPAGSAWWRGVSTRNCPRR
jgi:hypothetical protein